MKVMNTVDYLNATEKKAPATSNDMFALLMQMASLSPRPIAKCDDGFSLSIQASSAHHCEKGENGVYKSVELGCLSSPEESLSEYEDWDDSSTYGYVPVEVVDAIIAKHGGIFALERMCFRCNSYYTKTTKK